MMLYTLYKLTYLLCFSGVFISEQPKIKQKCRSGKYIPAIVSCCPDMSQHSWGQSWPWMRHCHFHRRPKWTNQNWLYRDRQLCLLCVITMVGGMLHHIPLNAQGLLVFKSVIGVWSGSLCKCKKPSCQHPWWYVDHKGSESSAITRILLNCLDCFQWKATIVVSREGILNKYEHGSH